MMNEAASEIFMVDDDEHVRELVLYALRGVGFKAAGFGKGTDFWEAVKRKTTLPDLVLLDIILPNEDGLSILKQLRNSSRCGALPVIMLSAKNSEYDKVKGLDMGADDYVTKPFGVTELISRVNAVLRRSGVAGQRETFECGSLRLDNTRRDVRVNGEKKTLTFKEYELLRYLLLNTGLVLSREKIMAAVWGYRYEGGNRTVDMHIGTLRQKLGAAAPLIETVRGVGYRLGD